MNIPTNRLRKMDSPLYGFSNHSLAVEGIIALPVLGVFDHISSSFNYHSNGPTAEKGFTEPRGIRKVDPWNLYVDGSSAVGSSGARIILISPEGFTIEYALRFRFQASNNVAEYEALLAGIRLAHALRVDSLSVHSDS
ncbi:hypothetical protein RJ639_007317 [Escallonia herrerae]|uniref:RNase H type-1 domain-containing protein n=1 Tax=Escallonia herrerae TaxID=1293975 RepID=A0AA88VX52_9ASTE|nr:hypothetical protein RJ639_007317 [Escallonia herrerae]